MLTTRFVAPYTEDEINELKLAALYFDEIEILEDSFYLTSMDLFDKYRMNTEPSELLHPIKPLFFAKEISEPEIIATRDHDNPLFPFFKRSLVPNSFKEHSKILTDEGIVKYVPKEETHELLENDLKKEILNFLKNNRELIYRFESIYTSDKPGYHLTDKDEMLNVFENIKGKLTKYEDFDVDLLINYYSHTLSTILTSVSQNKSVFTSSSVLNNILHQYYKGNSENILKRIDKIPQKNKIQSPSITLNAIKMSLPDVTTLSLEDVLEIRLQLRDELAEFRYEINLIQNELLEKKDIFEMEFDSRNIAQSSIDKKIKDMEKKLSSSKIAALSKLVSEIKNPKSYVPLLINCIPSMPHYLSSILGGSITAGLIGSSVYLDYKQRNFEIENNGLYYLLKLKKRIYQ